ncbi:enoyl-CoA hydratase/isomerase family protein [Arenicella xantha]|uniref:2-(1,2-epoxy-1,2-dihydrophenyl)acetyl-CoA isomerase n=1 Tax=Arenicella xantha TaxID=644221 RepID=A0A395JI64_9GAMM|nr:enoyl-CoA hydratase/isomerase family protein [Arenicella xantha]RBP49373.1 2-(1,2-epoxy-1,2-dihydrophenyl)acetyl-CoA isomerase [Arenicella xantha]
MSEYQYINYTISNRVATIALNTPKSLNALHQKLRLELIELVQRIEQDDEVRVVVLTGEGEGFCAGADLTEGMPGHDNFVDQCAAEYTPWLMAIHNSSKLYIAAVNGAAAGVGSAAVMNCDLIVMADNAFLYQAFSAIGLIPDGGASWLLLQKMGYQRAMEMAVDAGRLTAQQCLELGIANKIVPAEQLREQTQAWAEQLAAGAPLAQTALKKIMRSASSMTYAEVVDEEAREQSKLLVSEDSAQAIKAFFAKQKPQFKGR